jgi:aspartyl-tRNA(Asn)/glutamyl-tRNA(Gln) amidotransferase subunit A
MADAVMAGEARESLAPVALPGLRIGIVQGMAIENLEEPVSRSFACATELLGKAGVRLSDETLREFDGMAEVNAHGGGITPAEAFAVHRDRLERRGDDIDQNVRRRIERARNVPAADYITMIRRRGELVRAMDARMADVDVLALPTSPVVAPVLAELEAPDEFARRNAMSLRNTAGWNFFDCCAISLPLPRGSDLPTGLMLVARNGQDARLFQIAAAVERLFA